MCLGASQTTTNDWLGPAGERRREIEEDGSQGRENERSGEEASRQECTMEVNALYV